MEEYRLSLAVARASAAIQRTQCFDEGDGDCFFAKRQNDGHMQHQSLFAVL